MFARHWICIAALGACTTAPSSGPPPAPAVAVVGNQPSNTQRSPADAMVIDGTVSVTPPAAPPRPPVERPCSPPPAELAAVLERKVHEQLAQMSRGVAPAAPVPVTPICEEREGWLVNAAWAMEDVFHKDELHHAVDGTISSIWMVPARGPARWLSEWTRGPTYDFDGDGTSEASTVRDGAELKIWFGRGDQAAYAVLPPQMARTPDERWAAWQQQIVWLERGPQADLRAFGFRPGQARTEMPEAACALAGPGASCARSPRMAPAAAPVTRAIPRSSTSICATPDDATRARQEGLIEQLVLRRDDDARVISPLGFQWGCTSHGETPVAVSLDLPNDWTGFEWWMIRGDKPVFRRRVRNFAPDEWTASERIEIGDHGDFDGDGFDESIVIETWSGHGTSAHFTVRLAGRDRELPSGLIVRTPDGTRDAIVRLPAGPVPPRRGCIVDARGEFDGCMLAPPASWLPQGSESYDWEHSPPEIRVWRGTGFVALGRADVAKIVAATASARASLPPR